MTKRKKAIPTTAAVTRRIIREELGKIPAGTTVSNCHIVGSEFDPEAVEVLQTLAEALQDNARACGRIAGTFRGGMFETAIRIDANQLSLLGIPVKGEDND